MIFSPFYDYNESTAEKLVVSSTRPVIASSDPLDGAMNADYRAGDKRQRESKVRPNRSESTAVEGVRRNLLPRKARSFRATLLLVLSATRASCSGRVCACTCYVCARLYARDHLSAPCACTTLLLPLLVQSFPLALFSFSRLLRHVFARVVARRM